jgi:hypothetical protein
LCRVIDQIVEQQRLDDRFVDQFELDYLAEFSPRYHNVLNPPPEPTQATDHLFLQELELFGGNSCIRKRDKVN